MQYRTSNGACLLLLIVIFCAVCITSCEISKVKLDTEFQAIVTYNFGDSREPLNVVEDIVRSSYGEAAERLRLEKQFIEIIRSENATLACKDFVCRQLWRIGTKDSVPALEKMLVDEKTSDMARYALERNPSPEAGEAFCNALSKAQGLPLIGIINSLGERREEKSIDVLEKFTAVTDKEVAAAAATALWKIRGE